MGVALLGGFGDLNVDRTNQANGEKGDNSNATALALKPSALLRLRVPELKQKLLDAGVDLRKHPEAVEKKVSRVLLCSALGGNYKMFGSVLVRCGLFIENVFLDSKLETSATVENQETFFAFVPGQTPRN